MAKFIEKNGIRVYENAKEIENYDEKVKFIKERLRTAIIQQSELQAKVWEIEGR